MVTKINLLGEVWVHHTIDMKNALKLGMGLALAFLFVFGGSGAVLLVAWAILAGGA